MPNNLWSGNDFLREEFTQEERASMREMRAKLRDAWPVLEALSKINGGPKTLSAIVQIAGSARTLAGIVAIAGAFGLAIGWMVKQGWFS